MLHTSMFRAVWTLVFLALGLMASAWAQRDGDDGDYQILSARYGTSERNIDVTPRLKELARDDRRFRVTNDIFRNDPHPGERKTLRIYARGRDGQTRTFEYPEDGWVDGNQFTGWGGGNWGHGGWNGGWGGSTTHGGYGGGGRNGDDGDYQILSARYGTAARNVDVTERLRELARQDRRFRNTNDIFRVDPHPGERKTLRIYARGPDGHNRTFEYPEDGWVDGNQFTGWGGGNWGRGGGPGGWGDDQHPGSGHGGYGADRGGDRLVIVSASYGNGDRQRDVTYRVRSRVRNDRLDVRADNDLAGTDPAPGDRKTLWITYTVGGGRELRVRVGEDEAVRLP